MTHLTQDDAMERAQQDSDPVWLQISSGQGPLECAWVVARLVDVMRDDASLAGVSLATVHVVDGPEKDTALSALLEASGPAARRWASSWVGTIKWVGRSTFRPHHKRKNWFVGVALAQRSPTRQCEPDSSLDPKDLDFSTYRGSGPGGQHRNKVSTAVRVTHRPTGITARAQEERSQAANKKRALARLIKILELNEQDTRDSDTKARWGQHQALERGKEIRTFKGPSFKPA